MTDITLQLKATPSDDGFDILAISQGEAKGHGITFSAAVLQEAMSLYEGIPVFVDHAGLFESPSVRNLAGSLHNPTWNTSEQGIQLKLKPGGPAAQILLSLRDAARAEPAIMKAVGFSSVVNVKLDGKGNVTKVTRVRSTDVVIDPARGGKFLSASKTPPKAGLNPHRPMKGANNMDETNPTPAYAGATEQAELAAEINPPRETTQPTRDTLPLTREQIAALDQIQANRQATTQLLDEAQRMAALESQLAESNAVLVAQCEHLLNSGLAASRLPQVTQKRIRRHFEGRAFKPNELTTAIADALEEIASLTEGANIQGPSRDSNRWSMYSNLDQFRAAVFDLFGANRPDELKNVHPARLSGIREAYVLATGDQGFMGGYYPEYALVTANFPGIVADVQNKMLIQAWKDYEQVYGWWQKIVTVEHFTNLNDVKWIRTGTVSSLPQVNERGEYTELPIGDNKESSTWSKFGGYIPLTIEAVLRDDLRAFKRMPQELALAGMRNISEQVAAIFTMNSGAGPSLADGGALFNATAVTTAGGHANLLTTALGTDYTAWNAAAKAVFNQPMLVKNASGLYGAGKKQAIDPSYCLVPRDLKNAAEALFIPRWEAQAQNVAPVSPSWGGRVEPLTVPEWTDATDWAAIVDPKFVPGVMLGEIFGVKPQIFSASSEIDPAMFANDESRIKVRQFLTVGVADFRGLHKSNVP